MMLIKFPIISLHTTSRDDYGSFYIFKMRAVDLPEDLPYYPNARMPNLGGIVAKLILQTLQEQPESFYTKNAGGLHIVADTVVCRNNKTGQELYASLRLPDVTKGFVGHGLLDGGHTYACLQYLKKKDLLSPKVEVSVTLLYEVKDSEIPAISLARNTRKNVGSISRYNLIGAFDPLKAVLHESIVDNIQWKENNPGAIKSPFCHATHLSKMLACLNLKEYPPLEGKFPNSALASASAKQLLSSVKSHAFLINDALEIEKLFYLYVNKHYFRRKGLHGIAGFGIGRGTNKVILADGTIFDFNCTTKAIYPILFAFRILLDKDMNWIIPYRRAWENKGKELVTKLIDPLKKAEENNSSMDSVFRSSPKIYEDMSLFMQRYLYDSVKKSRLEISV